MKKILTLTLALAASLVAFAQTPASTNVPTKELSVLIVVQTVDIGVEPHLTATQRGMTMTLQTNAVDGQLC